MRHVLNLSDFIQPVIDWRFYDTIYTERYMGTLEPNLAAYEESAVHNVSAYKNITFMLAHGTGDDNGERNSVSFVTLTCCSSLRELGAPHRHAHASWSAQLSFPHVRRQVCSSCDIEGLSNETCSDHSLRKRGARRELYEWITSSLSELWGDADTKGR